MLLRRFWGQKIRLIILKICTLLQWILLHILRGLLSLLQKYIWPRIKIWYQIWERIKVMKLFLSSQKWCFGPWHVLVCRCNFCTVMQSNHLKHTLCSKISKMFDITIKGKKICWISYLLYQMLIMKKLLIIFFFSFVKQAKQCTILDFTKQNFSIECHILFYR